MRKKVLGVQCQKCHNVIPLTIEDGIYCPNCKTLMVVANLVTSNKWKRMSKLGKDEQ